MTIKPEATLDRAAELAAQGRWRLERAALEVTLEGMIDTVNDCGFYVEHGRDVCRLAEELAKQRRDAAKVAVHFCVVDAFNFYGGGLLREVDFE